MSAATLAQSQNSLMGTKQRANIEADGLRVTITTDSWHGEYVTYRSGDNFVVVVPQANPSLVSWGFNGRGVTEARVEQRGDDVALLFKIPPCFKPSLEQQQNRLEIVFSPSGGCADPVHTEKLTRGSDGMSPGFDKIDKNNGDASGAAGDPVGNSIPPSQPLGAVPQLPFDLTSFLKKNTEADALNLDLSVPESPAFTALGLTPQTIVRPATPQEFATSLLNGLDHNGNFQNGLAIDTAPFLLFNGENVTIKDYGEQYLTRLLSRTQFSFATVKGSSKDDLTTKLALGVNLTLWDDGDPRVYRPDREGDVLQCFVKKLTFSPNFIIPPTATEEEVARMIAPELARLKPIADKCRDDGRKANWNKSSWTVAYAPSWLSKSGNTSDFTWNGGTFWTSLAYGFAGMSSLEKIAQLIVHARYRSREQVPDPLNKGQFLTQNSLFMGARFRAGSPKFAFNFEDAFIRSSPLHRRSDTINRFTIGAETRISDNLYFVISAGSNLGQDTPQKKGFVMSSFKYGFNKKSQFNPQPQ